MDDLRVGDVVRCKTASGMSPWDGAIANVVEKHGDFVVVQCPAFTAGNRHSFYDRADLTKLRPAMMYRDAIFAVDPGACNLSGLVHSLHRHLPLIRHECNGTDGGTGAVNRHPAVVLFVSQMVYLATGDSIDFDAFSNALAVCKSRMAEHTEAEKGEPCVAS